MSPTFLCLGGQRCGTTWLYEALKTCPHVHVSSDKETDYFNRKIFSDNLASYEKYFDSPRNGVEVAVRGEVSPNYCMLKRAGIELIHKLYPNMRLVLILRNPVERSISQAWLDFCHMRNRPDYRIGAFTYMLHAERQRTRRRSDYVSIIRDWRAVFGAEALHIALYDDLVADPRRFFSDVLRHIQADDWPLADSLVQERVFASQLPEAPAFVRWYHARQYREQVVQLNELLGGRVTAWLSDLNALLAQERPWWNILRGVNKYLLTVPEKLTYAAYDAWRDYRYHDRVAAILRERDATSAPAPKPKRRTVFIQG
jgi:LPS sulfotransferase NodH